MEAGLTPIDAIVLAAGRSTRMGEPKAQLEIEPGVTFLEHTVKKLRAAGCRLVVAVLAADDDWGARLADTAGAAVVLNDMPESQQIDSIRLGIAYLPDDSAGALILPVDIPRVQQATIEELIRSFQESQAPVVLPVHDGTGGHPVLFAKSVYGELLASDLPRGAESIIDAHANDRRDVAVNDRTILIDIDTPDDFKRVNEDV